MRRCGLAFLLLTVIVIMFNGTFQPETAATSGAVLKIELQEEFLYTYDKSVGDTFEVSVVAENVPEDHGLWYWEFHLEWINELVNFTGETVNLDIWGEGNYLGPWVQEPADNEFGTYHQALNGKAPGVPQGGTFWLANLTFQIIRTPSKGYYLTIPFWFGTDLYSAMLLDKEFDNIPHDTVPSNVPDENPLGRETIYVTFVSIDVSVLEVVTSKRYGLPTETVGEGYSLIVNTTVENRGRRLSLPPENFSITVYANATLINTPMNVTLLRQGGQATIGFTWNTSGLALGYYEIRASVWTIPSKTGTPESTFTYGSVFVTIPGDLNGDKSVDSTDTTLLNRAFGSTIRDSTYNPSVDVDGNGFVDAKDAVVLGGHFGQHW